jgi:plasmid stabilization system protein ParE
VARRVSYTNDALRDLAQITRWLTQSGSGLTARRRLTAIWTAIEHLREQPCLWPLGQHTGVRELPCAGGYRAFYAIRPDTGRNDTAGDVVVLRVYGPGQDRGAE